MAKKSPRQQRVEHVALIIYQALEIIPVTFDEVADRNRQGWTFDGPSSASPNNWIRYSDVILPGDELRESWELANQWLNNPPA